jgi:hypothetical protein
MAGWHKHLAGMHMTANGQQKGMQAGDAMPVLLHSSWHSSSSDEIDVLLLRHR